MIFASPRPVEEPMGWVAEYCAICRRPQPCRLIDVSTRVHLYLLLPIGPRRFSHHEVECGECLTRLPTQRERYSAVSPERPADFSTLAAATMPEMPNLLGERLQAERVIRDHPHGLASEQRSEWLAEPLQILNWGFEQYYHSIKLDAPARNACYLTGLLAVILAIVTAAKLPIPGEAILISLGVVFGFVLYTLFRVSRVPHRVMRQHVLHRLVRSLQPLAPSAAEIDALLAQAKRDRLKLTQVLTSGMLKRALGIN